MLGKDLHERHPFYRATLERIGSMEELDRRRRRLLVINSSWPSREHPYLVYLFVGLRERYPNLQLFLFRKEEDVEFANKLVGRTSVDHIKTNALYRFSIRSGPVKYIYAIAHIFRHFGEAANIVRSCRLDGYNLWQALGQVLYNNRLLGKRYDLVYINALQTARHFSIRSFFAGCKVIVSSRGQDFGWNPAGYDKVLRDVDHLHALGSYLKTKAVERGFSSDKITIIPPAILPKEEETTRTTVEPEEFCVVSSSRLVWAKGYLYGLRAFALLLSMLSEGQRCRYVILGDGPEREAMKVEISRLGLEGHVLLAGWVDQTVVNKWLSKASVYMMLSIDEGFNNSVMQAQNYGLPCVVSDAGGLPENVVDGETGYVVPRYDSEVAAMRLYDLAVDESLRGRLGARAAERMQAAFSLSDQIVRYTNMFETVLGMPARSIERFAINRR